MQMQKWLASRHCATLKRFPTEKAKGEAVCIEREKKQKYNSSLLKRKSSEATTGSRKRRAGWPRADAVVLAGLARGRGSAPEEQSAEELDGSSTAGRPVVVLHRRRADSRARRPARRGVDPGTPWCAGCGGASRSARPHRRVKGRGHDGAGVHEVGGARRE
jgi:hypothetical protein